MANFITGFLLCFIISFITLVVYYFTNGKEKAQMAAYDKYLLVDELWYKSVSNDRRVECAYNGRVVTTRIDRVDFKGTNPSTYMYGIYINDIYCASIMKINDGYQPYWASYVIDQYIEEEIWGIVKAAHTSLITREIDEALTPKTKRSIFYENEE
jgi:hypothetical protein